MEFNQSNWVRIIASSILIASIVFALKIIFGMIPEYVLLIGILIPALLNKPESIKDTVIMGGLIGFIAGLLSSIFYLSPMVVITVIFVAFGIIGLLISYYFHKKS